MTLLKNKYSNNILQYKKSIKDAIKLLQNADLKLIVLVDNNGCLKGTLTDGDVRRGLLKGLSVDSKCSEAMTTNPEFIYINNNQKNIDQLLRRKIAIPVLNDNNCVIDIYTSDNTINKKSITPVIIMAGGKGTRLSPLTKTTPKPLLLVQNKPIVQNIIENLRDSGFTSIYLSVHYKAQSLIKYFGNGQDFGVNIQYLVEEKPLGTAGCLTLLDDAIRYENIMVINGDILTMMDFNQFLLFHKKSNRLISICGAEHNIEIPYATLSISEDEIIHIEEKPMIKNFINAGIYLLKKEIVQDMQKNVRIDMPDLLSNYTADKQISLYPLYEDWIDIGTHAEYEKANKK
ncbi:MAG: alcohol dehydrogenase [Gammaproteobacteria bacterium]|nr:alcohol dehydrogenase [Gammaproteobacteria bacterium]|tara:strand:- start:364 stop:1398 length:1035 start_codon:yes stop_codon:yes gene_type:complete